MVEIAIEQAARREMIHATTVVVRLAIAVTNAYDGDDMAKDDDVDDDGPATARRTVALAKTQQIQQSAPRTAGRMARPITPRYRTTCTRRPAKRSGSDPRSCESVASSAIPKWPRPFGTTIPTGRKWKWKTPVVALPWANNERRRVRG
jgi:hypothetical protein